MALTRGLVDSPVDRSETLRSLRRIERRLRRVSPAKAALSVLDAAAEEGERREAEEEEEEEEEEDLGDDEWEIEDALDDDLARPMAELWELLLDVVFSPLALRVRAAALLSVCFLARPSAPRAPPVGSGGAHWLRSVVSSTCQALEELQPTRARDAELLFAWLGFLESVLAAAPSRLFAPLVAHSMYAGMLAKMVRLLGACSTEVFAAATVCLARCHALEKQCQWLAPGGRLVLVADVLARPAQDNDGRQHVGGALLHVINSCGCPCPDDRLALLHSCLQLVADILTHPKARELLFLNDFKVLLDVVLREITDLPPEHESRAEYLTALDCALAAPAFRESQLYRRREILTALESLLDAGAQGDSRLPRGCVDAAQRLLLQYIDLLD